MNQVMKQCCRFCEAPLRAVFADLVASPPSNSFLTEEALIQPEPYYPLKLYVCEKCYLVQVAEYKSAKEIFSSDYVYFSSYSKSWLEHSKKYSESMIGRFKLNSNSRVMEIASNDGYLLQYFVTKGIPVLGIEPTASTAKVAKSKGVETWVEFFGQSLATKIVAEVGRADLLAANNVLAHVPDILDVIGGVKIVLSPDGVFTAEFPHLQQLIAQKQFDTIYHEHFSYFSLETIRDIYAKQGLRVFDVERLPTHGGSLRVYACHQDASHATTDTVKDVVEGEHKAGLRRLETYTGFQAVMDDTKNNFLSYLLDKKRQRKTVVGYGAAAKGNTFINYAGIKSDLIKFVVDASPHKQGRYLPGARIPVVSEDVLRAQKPDVVVILPWNLRTEISQQLEYIRSWGGKFVVAIPEVEEF